MNRTGSRGFEISSLALGAMFLLATLPAQNARAQDSAACSFSVGQPLRSRGDPFTLMLTRSPADATSATVTLSRVAGGNSVSAENVSYVPAKDAAPATIVGNIGSSVALGHYQVRVVIGTTPCYPSDPALPLSVVPPGNPGLHLEPFDPAYSDAREYVSFTDKTATDASDLAKTDPGKSDVDRPEPAKSSGAKNGPAPGPPVETRVTTLILRGHGFQPKLSDNVVYVNSVPQQLAAGNCAAISGDDEPAARQVLAQVVSSEELDVCRVPVPANGILRVQVAVADQLSDQQVFRVYPYGKTRVGIESGLIALLLALLPLGLLHSVKGSYTISKQEYKLRLLFLDPETDSYSLSKLQFYLWTVASLFSYAYLFISRVHVQNTIWPDVPPNLPGVIAIAAGTTVTSVLVTASKGSKGAGPARPGFADFITSGGVVAPDRVQMLLWTLFGVGAFIVTTLAQSPAEIQTLPTIPDNFLYLMGLSSAGYLGGKLARKAGPVITEISISPTDPDDAIVAAASTAADSPDFTDAFAAAQVALQRCGAPSNVHAQATVKALSDALSATRAAANTAEFGQLLETLAQLQSSAETEAAASAAAYQAQPDLAQDAATAQAATGAIEEFYASVTQAIAQTAAFHLREALEIPRIARVITIRGSNLSAESLLQIDHADLPFRMLLDSTGKQMPEIVAREDATPTFARVLRLTIDPANLGDSDLVQFHNWFGSKGSHTFTLTNPDGQMAEEGFPLPPGEAQKSGSAS
jgi:hypothetical protein